MNKVRIAGWSDLAPPQPTYALVSNVDPVVIRREEGEQVSVLHGRCLHRGALLADGRIDGDNLICGVHDRDYRYRTGVSEYNNEERLRRFSAWIENDGGWVDADEIAAWEEENPQPFGRDEYRGLDAEVHGTPAEP